MTRRRYRRRAGDVEKVCRIIGSAPWISEVEEGNRRTVCWIPSCRDCKLLGHSVRRAVVELATAAEKDDVVEEVEDL